MSVEVVLDGDTVVLDSDAEEPVQEGGAAAAKLLSRSSSSFL